MPGSQAQPALASFEVGVDNVIFSIDTAQNRLLVLLTLLDGDRWCLPGTPVGQGESLESAAYRILAEKIRVKNLYLEQLYTFDSLTEGLPLENSANVHHLCVSYFAIVRYVEAELIGEDITRIAWYAIEQIPSIPLAHQQVLAYGHRRLRNKLEYSPVAFDVLPETFTLSDLYQFYTVVLGEDFSDYSNFRSRLLKLGFLIDTGVKVTRGAGRPASLYRFDAKIFETYQDKPMIFI